MKDFGRWFQEQALPVAAPEPVTYAQLDALGFEVDDDHTGHILAVYCKCCMCERRIKLTEYLSVEEIAEGADAYNQYCGGSPRCCP